MRRPYFIIIIVPIIIAIIAMATTMMLTYGQSDEEAHHATSENDSIDYVVASYWVGFFGLGTATGILSVHRSILKDNRLALSRYVIAALAITTGMIHLLLIPEHLEESFLFGIFFVVSGTALIAYGSIAAFSRKKIMYYIGIGGIIILTGLYSFTRLIAVPFSEHSGVESVSGIDIVTQVVQIALLGALIYAFAAQRKLEMMKVP